MNSFVNKKDIIVISSDSDDEQGNIDKQIIKFKVLS